jgi:hypothetical protein
MRKRRLLIVLALLGLLCAAVVAEVRAGSVLINGGAGQINQDCIPFGCGHQVQFLISSSFFSGPIDIGSMTFFQTNPQAPNTFDPATYTFLLSTTTVDPSSPNNVFAANVTSPQQFFASYVQPAGVNVPSSFTITGVPFLYNPLAGNLLLEIDKPDSAEAFSAFTDNNSNLPGESRVWATDNSGVGNVNTGYGTVVQFNPAVVPEPATLTLAGLGLLGAVGWGVRRRKVA